MAPVLITGATGKVGRRVVKHLTAAGFTPRAGTRTPVAAGQIRFDWADATSFGAMAGAQSMLIVAPPGDHDPLGTMRPGLDYAVAAGVRRFALAGASSIDIGGPLTGQVSRWLRDTVPEWIVLRPSWFMQNFSEGQHAATIRAERRIYSATGDGRVPFIDAEDIARVAVQALTAPTLASGEWILTGPATLSYDDVAGIVGATIGHEVIHQRLDVTAMTARFVSAGLPRDFAEALAGMDAAIAAGAEDRTTDTVARITGSPPTRFAAFAAEAGKTWLG